MSCCAHDVFKGEKKGRLVWWTSETNSTTEYTEIKLHNDSVRGLVGKVRVAETRGGVRLVELLYVHRNRRLIRDGPGVGVEVES